MEYEAPAVTILILGSSIRDDTEEQVLIRNDGKNYEIIPQVTVKNFSTG